MAYCAKIDLYAYISQNNIVPFLDDDRDGSEDAGLLDEVIASCAAEVDGSLASIYTVPFVTVPPAVKAATIIFVCEALYARRLTPDQLNPFKTRADEWRVRLKQIGSGDLPLDATLTRSFTPGAAVTVPITFNTTTL